MLTRSTSTGSLGSIGSSFSGMSSGVSKALKRVNSLSSLGSSLSKSGLGGSGLQGQRDANRDADIMAEETGEWHYLVIDAAGMRAREDASYCKETKRTDANFRFKEGTIVPISRRRTAGWTKWLGLKNGDGWLFDVSPKDKKVRLVEVEVAQGTWQYVCLAERVPVLQKPLLSYATKSAKVGQMAVCMREVVQIQERVRPLNGKGSFLKLADGRGWALDFIDGQQVLQRQFSDACPDSSEAPPSPVGFGRMGNMGPLNRGGGSGYSCGFNGNTAALGGGYAGGGSSGSDGYGRMDPLPGVGSDLGEPECGMWEYVVVDPKGLSLRSTPTYDQSQKSSKRIEEGEVVTVVERIPGDGTTFLRIESLGHTEGWVFDRQPGGTSKVRLRMMEIKVERGLWHYFVIAERGVALRARCSFSESAKVGKGPQKGALVPVTERVRAGESTFLRLKEGGWIFDVKNGKRVVNGPVPMQVLPSYTMATVHAQATLGNNCSGGIHLLSSPTSQKWAITKFFLLHASKVHATMCCEAEGICWILVKKGEGAIEGWAAADSISLEGAPDSVKADLTAEAPAGCQRWEVVWSSGVHVRCTKDRTSESIVIRARGTAVFGREEDGWVALSDFGFMCINDGDCTLMQKTAVVQQATAYQAPLGSQAPLPPDIGRPPVQASVVSISSSHAPPSAGPAMSSSHAPPPPAPVLAPPPPQPAPVPLASLPARTQACSCGAVFFDEKEHFCRTCGSRRARMATEAPLAAALRAGFTQEPRDILTHGPAGLAAPDLPEAPLTCLGCGLPVTPSNTFGKLGCCKGCGRRWSEDKPGLKAGGNVFGMPPRSSVCW